jgi:hypothetical protein
LNLGHKRGATPRKDINFRPRPVPQNKLHNFVFLPNPTYL